MSAFNGFFDNVGGGANFLPIVKFDSRSGRISRRDRDNGETTEVDITKTFRAIVDFENVEIGYINFSTGGAPDFRMVRMADGTAVENPGEGYKRGVRFVVKLSKECGGDVREFASNAAAFLDGAKRLAEAYNAGVKENPGKLPVVVLEDSVAKTTGEGARKSTNYSPVFTIVSWAKRPDDLVYTSRNSSPSQAASGPASTGSTKVAAPVDDESDFG